MFDATTLTLFLIAATVLLVTPGPAVLYIIARSIDQGRAAGLVSVAGVGVGTLFHVVAAALGISAILVTSATAFAVVKYAGAAYLVVLGIRKLREKEAGTAVAVTPPQPLSHIFTQGMVVNILNPKTALFFFAFLPQFIDPAHGSAAGQMVALGVMFVLLGLMSDGVYALLAGTASHWLRDNLGFLRTQRYLAGTIYIALGVFTAVSGSHKD